MSIKYNKKYFDLVNHLSTINPSIIFDNKNDVVEVKRADPSNTVIYVLRAPKSNFEFEGDDIAFYNFPEVYRLLSVFKEPEINIDGNKFSISENKSKLKYKLSDSEIIPKVNGNASIDDPDFEFNISSEQFEQIKKMIALISAEKIKFKVTENSKNVIVEFYNLTHSNNWENSYEVTKGSKESFNFIINAKVFTLIPKNDYLISVDKEGLVKIKYIDDNIDLNIFVPEDCEE